MKKRCLEIFSHKIKYLSYSVNRYLHKCCFLLKPYNYRRKMQDVPHFTAIVYLIRP